MKSRSRALLDKSIGAMISAIEVYNKPSFRYREETFSVLAINAWELLLKAKWLKEHENKIKSLYVMEYKNKADGTSSKVATARLTASGNPYTVSIRYLAAKLEEAKLLTPAARANLEILIDIRDSAIHFYNKNIQFAKVLRGGMCGRTGERPAVLVENLHKVADAERPDAVTSSRIRASHHLTRPFESEHDEYGAFDGTWDSATLARPAKSSNLIQSRIP